MDRIYCGKQHLSTSLPALAESAGFSNLKLAIMELHGDVIKQIYRMDQIYQLLNLQHNSATCIGMNTLLKEMFDGINPQNGEKVLSDLSLIFYLQNIESIESASFQVLRITAKNLNNPDVSQLLRENFDEATEDRGLLLQIGEQFLALHKLS